MELAAMTDPRLRNALALAHERQHPHYAFCAWWFASMCGDWDAVCLALSLGAADYKPEPKVYMQSEDKVKVRVQPKIVQLRLFEEAA